MTYLCLGKYREQMVMGGNKTYNKRKVAKIISILRCGVATYIAALTQLLRPNKLMVYLSPHVCLDHNFYYFSSHNMMVPNSATRYLC